MAETALDWAPPLSQAPATSGDTSAPSARSLLDTPAGELALFRSLITHRLVGPNKHFDMVAVLLSLQRALASEEGGEEAMRGLKSEDVWSKWRELYDQKTLEAVWDEQQEQLLPTPLPSPTPADDSTAPEAAQPSPTPSQTLSKRVTNFHFPRRQFDLSPDPSIQVAAFQRGLLPKGSKHESPVPDDAPLREVSVPLPEGQDGGETSGRGKRKKRAGGAAAGGSPRKKQKVEKKLSGGEEDESELSELSDADEVAESEEGDAEGDEDAGEDGEEDDGTSVTGTAVTADDDSASTATEADAKRKPADKAAAIRSLPSSNRRSRVSNAKERQDSTPASSDAGISTPAKKGTRSTAKTAKKEEAPTANAPRSSRRRR